jgi:hypothetical protein
MRLQNPNVPDWVVEVDDKDKDVIKAHKDAGWQEMSTKRGTAKKAVSASAAKAAEETSSVQTTEGD